MNETSFSTAGRGVFKYKAKNVGAFLYGPQEHLCLAAMTLGFTQFKESIGGGRFFTRPFYMKTFLSHKEELYFGKHPLSS
jgi:hypothetical protein